MTSKELILIVDDEPMNLQVIGVALTQAGYKTAAAQSGKQVLDLVEKISPSLILLDIMMPEMNGFEVCKKLKEIKTLMDVPVIFVTALSDTDSILQGVQSGGSDYINKPIIKAELLARVKVHLENRHLVKNLQDLNQQKNKFLGMAAHDLRNPLGSIIGFTDLLIEKDYGEISDEQEKVLEKISTASQRMLMLVNDLLDVSVIESGKLTLNTSQGSLKNIIEERLDLLKIIANKKDIQFKATIESDKLTLFDSERIVQVVDNLLANGIKFSPAGSMIELGLSASKDHMTFWVSNPGQGIPEEEQKKIFGEFHHLSTKTAAGEKSTGLGLAISQKIILAHQGKIWVESQPGEKTTFYVTLPI